MIKQLKVLGIVGALVMSLSTGAFALDEIKGGVVSVSVLNLRENATTQSNILKKLPEKTDLSVFDEQDDFYKVSANGVVGFVSKEYVEVKDVWNISNGGGIKVTVSALNLREKPSLDAGIMDKLYQGQTAEIIGINNGWLKVTSNIGTGYVSPEYVEYVELSSSSQGSSNSEPAVTASATSSGQKVANLAQQYLGYRYVYGAESPSTGFDCSGLTSYVYSQFGISINRTAKGQTSNGYRVAKSDLRAGDLVFFAQGGGVDHVGIYIGNGNFIHAVKPGDVVSIDPINTGYYNTYFWGARRIIG